MSVLLFQLCEQMHSHVFFQVAFHGERLAARDAAERPLACVDAHVTDQVTFPAKTLAAVQTAVSGRGQRSLHAGAPLRRGERPVAVIHGTCTVVF